EPFLARKKQAMRHNLMGKMGGVPEGEQLTHKSFDLSLTQHMFGLIYMDIESVLRSFRGLQKKGGIKDQCVFGPLCIDIALLERLLVARQSVAGWMLSDETCYQFGEHEMDAWTSETGEQIYPRDGVAHCQFV